MNKVIEIFMNHRSYRSYKEDEIKNEDLQLILDSAQAAPSWIHGQQVSIIVVKENERRQRLAELCGNQAYISQAPVFLVFCADFHRAKLASEMEGLSSEALQDVDTLLVGATDVGLAMGNAIAAAESLGLGTVPIGGIRRNSLEIVEYLDLPKYVIPISGLCVGYPEEDPAPKPRLPKEAVVHTETYNKEQQKILIDYNVTYINYLQSIGAPEISWTNRVATFYKNTYYQNVGKMIKQQGFICKDLEE